VHHRDLGDNLLASKDHEAALTEYRKALGFLGTTQAEERAELYVRLATAKWSQEKRKEAISNLDKALTLRPDYRPALEALVVLNVSEKDFKAVHVAEERLLATITDPAERFIRLVEFGDRWEGMGSDPVRARSAFERAHVIREDDLTLLSKLRRLYENAKEPTKAIEVRRQIAELTPAGRDRAVVFAELAAYCLQVSLEAPAIETYELAIDNDPSLSGPIDALEKIFAEREEWTRLEAVYRRALSRLDKLKGGDRRRRAAWSVCSRLGILFRDHLNDSSVALAYFERAMDERPDDHEGHLTVVELARSLGRYEPVLAHLRHAARLKPERIETFHEIFDAAQKLSQPDIAVAAASVTLLRNVAEAREKFLFDEHKPKGNPPFTKAIVPESWDLLRDEGRDKPTEAVLIAIAPAAIAARLFTLTAEAKLPSFDPAMRQDALKSTVSAVRSLAWGSHFLGMDIPAIYLREDAPIGLVAIPAEEPTVLAGTHALRGRSLQELAFFVGRHLAYHVNVHRLLLFYPSLEELTACFVTALAIALPDRPIPPKVQGIVDVHKPLFEQHIQPQRLVAIRKAVSEFEAAQVRPDLTQWAGSVERCATRAGLLLCGNLEVAASVLRSEPRAALDPEAKVDDLCSFAVSESIALLREEMGVTIKP
jgi:tetratricopeptide (TPR) repeat protein